MPTAKSNRIELCYETFGDRANPAMLLAMGLGLQLLHWPVGFCRPSSAIVYPSPGKHPTPQPYFESRL